MNTVDLLFVLDVTGSMGSLIYQAKEKMQSILESLTKDFQIDLKVGLSLYRDHPSQDTSFVTVTFDLMDVKNIKEKISLITVGGGGDTPEAVLDGIVDGINDMTWRNGRRIVILIGDAPAHGMIEREHCCTCGLTWGKAVAVAQEKRVTIYSISLTTDSTTNLSFKTLSNFTGGLLIESDDAMNAIIETLTEEFDNVNLDSKVLEMLSKNVDSDKICDMLNIDREKFSLSKSRIAQFS
jgi:von Willebrand factor type A domain